MNESRRGHTPSLIVLTDGRANIARDGTPGRAAAEADASASAKRLRLARIRSMLVDTSPRPQGLARTLAEALDAAYLPLPFADATSLAQAVRAAHRSAGAAVSSA